MEDRGFEPLTFWMPFEKGAFIKLFISVYCCACYVANVYFIKIYNYSLILVSPVDSCWLRLGWLRFGYGSSIKLIKRSKKLHFFLLSFTPVICQSIWFQKSKEKVSKTFPCGQIVIKLLSDEYLRGTPLYQIISFCRIIFY